MDKEYIVIDEYLTRYEMIELALEKTKADSEYTYRLPEQSEIKELKSLKLNIKCYFYKGDVKLNNPLIFISQFKDDDETVSLNLSEITKRSHQDRLKILLVKEKKRIRHRIDFKININIKDKIFIEDFFIEDLKIIKDIIVFKEDISIFKSKMELIMLVDNEDKGTKFQGDELQIYLSSGIMISIYIKFNKNKIEYLRPEKKEVERILSELKNKIISSNMGEFI